MFGRFHQRLPQSGLYVPNDFPNGAMLVADRTQSNRHVWANGPRSPKYGLWEYDTFLNGIGTNGQKTMPSNSGGTTTLAASLERPGVVNMVCSGNGNIAGLIGAGSGNANRVSRSNETHEINWWFKTPANLATPTDDYSISVGLRDVAAGATTYDITARYSNAGGPTFNLHTNNVGAASANVGQTAVVQSTWYHTRVRIRPPNSIWFYLTPQGQAERLEFFYEGTIPQGDMAPSLVMVKNSATATIFTVAADAWEFWSSFDSPF